MRLIPPLKGEGGSARSAESGGVAHEEPHAAARLHPPPKAGRDKKERRVALAAPFWLYPRAFPVGVKRPQSGHPRRSCAGGSVFPPAISIEVEGHHEYIVDDRRLWR